MDLYVTYGMRGYSEFIWPSNEFTGGLFLHKVMNLPVSQIMDNVLIISLAFLERFSSLELSL
jgi:hypothetical protein